MTIIDKFEGEYFFLSNFYECSVSYGGYTFENSEAAFHAFKCPYRAQEFTDLNPSEAKRLGRRVHLRNDWEEVKDKIMYDIFLSKFSQNKDLKDKLLATVNAILIEGNTWNDTYWGVCKGVGKNMLGQILMRVRESLKSS